MIGVTLIIAGLIGIWAVVKGKAGPVVDAIMGTGFDASLNNAIGNIQLGASGSSGATDSGVTNDSGTHSILDPATGLVTTIDKTYAQMTDSEKDGANAFAHAHPNGL